MFAIAFDMVISDLRKNYGDPYNKAYFEIWPISIDLAMRSFFNQRPYNDSLTPAE